MSNFKLYLMHEFENGKLPKVFVKHNVTVPLQRCLTSASQKFDQTMANLILNVIRPKFWIETVEKLIFNFILF